MPESAEEINRMGLERVVVGLRSLLEGKDMIEKATELKREEKDVVDNSGPEKVIKEALSDYLSNFGPSNSLPQAIDRAVLEITQNLITVEGIEINFSGVSIKIPQEPVPAPVTMPFPPGSVPIADYDSHR